MWYGFFFVHCARWFKLLGLWLKFPRLTIQMKAFKLYFPVVLFIMLYEVVLTFESMIKAFCVTILMKSTGPSSSKDD